MAPSEYPETPPQPDTPPATTGIQTPSPIASPAEAPSISLPPLPPPPAMDPAKLLRLCRGLDAALVVVVLLFAFVVASFPVFNPDFFRQLATGRLLLQGQYHFGVDPFVYSAGEGDYFVNHSWLFALLMYGLYQLPAIGGAAIVVFKALLIVALAEILLRVSRRPGQSPWIPAACTALAILVISHRLYLQPSCLSFLFLGATLWLLTAQRPNGKRFWWLLPLLFALWVNCDRWFFLGPLTVALYLAGELVGLRLKGTSVKPQAAQGDLLTLGLVLLVGAAACLLNPHHVHALTLPTELGLSPAGDLIEHDPQFHAHYLSPLRKDYYEPYLGLSVAGLAYWPLLLLGLVSFVFVHGRAPWWRLLVWIGFALMSLYNTRAIPFFAIVAGPIAALNWLDYAAQQLDPQSRLTMAWRNWLLGGRALTVVLGGLLVIAAVPGWLQSQPRDQRRLGWSVRPDPSLKAMAQAIHEWRQDSKLDEREPHWFNIQVEVADYLAYFSPGDRGFVDQGLPDFPTAAQDYLSVCQALEAWADEPPNAEAEAIYLGKLRRVLHKRRVRYWIFDNRSGQKANQIARRLLFGRPEEWVPCYQKGRIAIFAWRDAEEPEAPDPSRRLALNLKAVAFGPEAEPAPPRGPEPAPPRSWWETCWDVWWRPVPPRSLDEDTVALCDVRFQIEQQRRENQHYRQSRAWQASVAASSLAAALPHGPMPNSLLALSWSSTYDDLFPRGALRPVREPRPSEAGAMRAWIWYMNGQPHEPPTSLYLGIRAARRAVLANPENAAMYFELGLAYQRLRELPQEQNFPALLPHLADIRRTQLVAALHNCLRLNPNRESAARAHEILFRVYNQLRYLDAAVHHRREALDKFTAAGPPPGVSATQYNQTLDRMTEELEKLDADLKRQRDRYDLTTASKFGLDKVRIALELRLMETALAELQKITQEEIDPSNPTHRAILKRMAEAALELGQLDRARELLLPDPENMAGKPVNPDYLDLHVRLAAARGDYAEADRILADALRHAWKPPPGQRVIDSASQVAPSLAKALLGEGRRLAGTPCMPWFPNDPRDIFQRPWLVQNPSDFWIRRWRLEAIWNGLMDAQQRSEWHLTRGWLALEAGHCVEARKHFQAVRATVVSGDTWGPQVNRDKGWLSPEIEIPAIQQLDFRHHVMHDLSQRYLTWLGEERP